MNRVFAGFLFAFAAVGFGSVVFAQDAQTMPPQIDHTFFLRNVTGQEESADVLNGLRTVLSPRARAFLVLSSRTIVVHGWPSDIDEAQRVINDLDRPQPTYRLTYTLRTLDGGKEVGSQSFAVRVASGTQTDVKQGIRTNSGDMLYVGLSIEAKVYPAPDGIRLYSKLDQSELADGTGPATGKPAIVRETRLEGTAMLTFGKPAMLGSLDVPGSTRHEDVEVTAELVR